MNFISNLQTRRNSVNSSFATMKAQKNHNETMSKNLFKNKTRFSYQEQLEMPKKLQRNSSYREQFNFNSIENSKLYCMNHNDKQASHVVFENSDNSMHYCERCAILIASKGFNVSRLSSQANKQNIAWIRNAKDNHQVNFCKRFSKQSFKNHKQKQSQDPQIGYKQKKTLDKIFMSNKVFEQLEKSYNKMKETKKSHLSQIDCYTNELNQNIDFLENYFEFLHEEIEKQKSRELKQIVAHKQYLQHSKSLVTEQFTQKIANLKKLKNKLFKSGQVSLNSYLEVIDHSQFQNFSLNFQQTLKQLSALNHHRQTNLYQITQEILQTIAKINDDNEKHRILHLIQRNFTFDKQQRQVSMTRKINFISKDESNLSPNFWKQTDTDSNVLNSMKQRLVSNINTANDIQHSMRSLQLSFENDENSNHSSMEGFIESEENNFTLNQYINKGQLSSFNLLLTSTDMN